MKKYSFVIIILSLLLFPFFAFALNLTYPEFGGLNINDPDNQSLPTIAGWLYSLIVGISGLAAFIMLVYGGFQWLISLGNPSRVADARDIITKALLGLLLVLSSFIVVQFINPELTSGLLSGLPDINKIALDPAGFIPPPKPDGETNFKVAKYQVKAGDPEIPCTGNCSSASVEPGGAVWLNWDATKLFPKPSKCIGQSNPIRTGWNVDDKPLQVLDDTEKWTLPSLGTYQVILACGDVLLDRITVFVTNTPCNNCGPAVTLEVKEWKADDSTYSSGPFSYPPDLSSGRVTFKWTSNGDRCEASQHLFIFGDSPNGIEENWVIRDLPPNKISSFVLECFNSTGSTQKKIEITKTVL